MSIPKFTKESELTENQKLYRIGQGIHNEVRQARMSGKLRSGSMGPDSPNGLKSSQNAAIMH